MACRLTKNIKHAEEYNAGGVTEIYLVDIRDFVSYQFRDDKLYDECHVDRIRLNIDDYTVLDSINETSFSESKENNKYKQELRTFIRTLEGIKTSSLLLASQNRYVIVLRTRQNRAFTFGSDGGASISFSQQTGQLGETEGYSIAISKESIYPLFEINFRNKDSFPQIFDFTFNNKFN